jgi:TolB-like protein
VQTIQIVPSRPRIAVLSFENLAESEEGARIFARLMQDQLAQFSRLDVIPAGEVEATVLRARIRLPILMDNEQSRNLQRALDADYFVLGTVIAYQTNQDPYAGPVPIAGISLQLRDARTGATVWSDTFHENGSAGEWLFGLGVEHDITRLAHSIARRAAGRLERITRLFPCGQIAP